MNMVLIFFTFFSIPAWSRLGIYGNTSVTSQIWGDKLKDGIQPAKNGRTKRYEPRSFKAPELLHNPWAGHLQIKLL